MATVREIGGPVTWIALPTATAALPGVAAWRGRAVAVADLAAVLGAGERLTPPTGRMRTLYLQQGTSTLAVPVDAVREPLTVADSDIRPPRARTESFCTGELDVEGHTTVVVDLVRSWTASVRWFGLSTMPSGRSLTSMCVPAGVSSWPFGTITLPSRCTPIER